MSVSEIPIQYRYRALAIYLSYNNQLNASYGDLKQQRCVKKPCIALARYKRAYIAKRELDLQFVYATICIDELTVLLIYNVYNLFIYYVHNK